MHVLLLVSTSTPFASKYALAFDKSTDPPCVAYVSASASANAIDGLAFDLKQRARENERRVPRVRETEDALDRRRTRDGDTAP